MNTCVCAYVYDAHTHTNYTQKTVMLCMYALLAFSSSALHRF